MDDFNSSYNFSLFISVEFILSDTPILLLFYHNELLRESLFCPCVITSLTFFLVVMRLSLKILMDYPPYMVAVFWNLIETSSCKNPKRLFGFNEVLTVTRDLVTASSYWNHRQSNIFVWNIVIQALRWITRNQLVPDSNLIIPDEEEIGCDVKDEFENLWIFMLKKIVKKYKTSSEYC